MLRIFKAVADEGGVARAAERLHCVQSNVSTRLTQFEKKLDVKLFHRVGNRLIITQDGVRLLDYAERLLQLAEEAKAAVTGKGAPSGPLRIGSMETAAALRLPPILAKYHEQYPQVNLEIQTGPTHFMLEQVLNHMVDIGVVAGPINCPDLNQQNIFEEELVLVTELGHGPVTTAADVASSTILSFRAGCAYRYRLEQWFTESGIQPKIVEFGAFETILACVGAGMGVSLMPVALLIKRNLLSSVRIHTLPRRLARVDTMLIWRKDICRHAARDAFIAHFPNAPEVPEHVN
ncbi:LysR family transcriptional regulator [Massilia rhizosphaerae]|uniref:LysR family transcriptional regulator n=1 Tax=Massilia rhizosphaerae TaxID=2784389 RepID=UPI001E6439DB|nr:LysR family transcriptional regulator [Massilia rhizosphaerae]